jgi:heme/copper-type cytochrome/quinol oxidase subunit 2
MRVAVLIMCRLIAAGVLVAMYLSVWSTRNDPERADGYRKHVAAELVWTSIPILILIAAAVPAVVAVLSANPAK